MSAAMTIPIQAAVERLIEARSTLRPVASFSEAQGELTLEHAYAIQDALRAELDRRGERPIGWKLGATSPSGQAVMGVTEPACGFLTASQHASGAALSLSRFANVGVEAEVAFRMRAELAGPGVTPATAVLAVEGAAAALELPDFIFSGTARIGDFVANSVHAKAIVVRTPFIPLEQLDLAREEIVYEQNDVVVGTYTATEVMGNPLNALAWLANHLPTRGLALSPGDVVMSGSISKMVRPKAGDTIRARFAHLGMVSVSFVP